MESHKVFFAWLTWDPSLNTRSFPLCPEAHEAYVSSFVVVDDDISLQGDVLKATGLMKFGWCGGWSSLLTKRLSKGVWAIY